jgi:hypothetical protein
MDITKKDITLIVKHLSNQDLDKQSGNFTFTFYYKSFINKKWVIEKMDIRANTKDDALQKFTKNKSVSLIKRIVKQ